MRGKGSCGSCHCGGLEWCTHGLSQCASRCGPHLILCPAPLPPLEESEEEERIERSRKSCGEGKKKEEMRLRRREGQARLSITAAHEPPYSVKPRQDVFISCKSVSVGSAAPVAINLNSPKHQLRKKQGGGGNKTAAMPINIYHSQCALLLKCRWLQRHFEK